MIGKTLYAWVLVNYKLNRFSQWRLRKWHTTKQWYRSNSPSTPTLIKSPTLPSLASRLGYIAFGIIIIGIINSSRRPLRWGDDISTTQPILGASSPNQQKLFVNSLPFEDTVTILTFWILLYQENTIPPQVLHSLLLAPGPHILYHAHPSSFSVLYDTGKASDNSISEYSLDYFLINIVLLQLWPLYLSV